MKKILAWFTANLDLTSDLITLIIAAYLIIRYQTINPKPDATELLVGILAVLCVLAISGFIEKRSRLTRIENQIELAKNLLENKVVNRVKADDFFERDSKVTEEFFTSANTILISGITLGNTSRQFAYVIGERLKAGANIKMMLLSPEQGVLKQIVLRSWGEATTDYYKKRLENTEALIEIMGNTTGAKGSLEIGFLPYAPSFGIMLVDPITTQGAAYVEVYHHNSPEPGPCFYLSANKDPYWFNFFREQFELMWKQSTQKTILEDGGNKYKAK